ncbi:MAG: ABC transporter permease subunit [Gemmatimonadales bacterium]|nr:ABC transporter permease subunit [Gemmatimonadales bacterium]MYK03271.1 ABC transporter permease subunit [Candidatus Palauibacter ramosifaciens]
MDPLLEALRLITSGDLYVRDVILRSLQISGSALLLAMVIGLPIGIAVGLTRFRLRLPLVAVINAGLAFPPVVVGLGVFLVLSRAGPLGDLQLLYTPAAMIGAQAILAGPYIAAVSLAAVENIPPDIALQARALGASRRQAIVLQLREVRTSLVAAVAAGFGAIISEVGAVMMVGGNILGETRVMTTAIVLETRRGNFDVAIAMGIVLMLIALGVNAVLLLLGRRTIRRGQVA